MNESFEKTCSICHSEKVTAGIKKLIFGLISYRNVECGECSAVFKKDGEKWMLVKIQHDNNAIGRRYAQQSLFDQEWINIGNGGMSDSEQREAETNLLMEKINSGELKVKVIRADIPVILQKNEDALCVLPNICLCEFRVVRVSGGGYGGTNFRVTKGISLRFGKFSSRSESHPEMRKIDEGTLVITNKRFVYSGALKTVQIDLRKIVQIDPFDDGIGLHKENREKTQYFSWTDLDALMGAISTRSEGRARNELKRINELGLDKNEEIEIDDQGKKDSVPLTGFVLKSIIEGAIKN